MKELLYEHDNRLSEFVYEKSPIVDVVAGGKHSFILTGSGSVYSFGFGGQG
jgi:alpha-tubulin suppressor-like RCC1 family protein